MTGYTELPVLLLLWDHIPTPELQTVLQIWCVTLFNKALKLIRETEREKIIETYTTYIKMIIKKINVQLFDFFSMRG